MSPADLFRALENLTNVMQNMVSRYTSGPQLKAATGGTAGAITAGLQLSSANAHLSSAAALKASADDLSKAATAITTASNRIQANAPISYKLTGMTQGEDGYRSALIGIAEPLKEASQNLLGNSKMMIGYNGYSGPVPPVRTGSGAAAIQNQEAKAGGNSGSVLGSVATAIAGLIPGLGQVAGVMAGVTAAATGIVAAGAPNVFATLTESLTLLSANIATALTPAFTQLAFYIQDVAEEVKSFLPQITNIANFIVPIFKMIGNAFMTAARVAVQALDMIIETLKSIPGVSWLLGLDKKAAKSDKRHYISMPQEMQATRMGAEDVRARVQNQGLGMSSIQQKIWEQLREQFELQKKQLEEQEQSNKIGNDIYDSVR